MNAVWRESKADGRARLVLLAIADHQGELGAWPSVKTLADMVNASERSVQRDIEYLQQIGELEVHYQKAPIKSHWKSNLYFVTLPGVTDGVTNTPSGVTNTASGVTAGGVQSLIEPLEETITKDQANALFDEFWKEYPKKSDMKPARKAFMSALNRAKFEDILASVIAYKAEVGDKEPKYIKNPATWLNADAWENVYQPSPDSVAAEKARQRKQRDLEESKRFLEEQAKLAEQSVAPPKCPHGESIARCVKCLRS